MTRWHRPLILLAIVMAVLAVTSAVLAFVAPHEILGQNAWFKPVKFALSIGIYALTIAWLIDQLPTRRRLGNAMGNVIVVTMLVEMAIIVGAAALGATSHFNVSSPLSTTLWSVMAVSIVIAWLANLVLGILVALAPGPDTARNLAVRAAIVIGLAGMAVAFFMTSPTADQLRDFQGIAGAHAVGVPDGGPGLPLLGWSTEAGDLRVPHFIGMHALQLIPLGLLALELGSRRVAVLRSERVRFWLVLVWSAGYAALVVLTTLQALAGESIVRPSTPTLAALVVIVVCCVVGSGLALGQARGSALSQVDDDLDASASRAGQRTPTAPHTEA